MATTKVIIRVKRTNKNGFTPISIKYTHEQRSILFATGQRIEPKYFDPRGFVKKSFYGFTKLNDILQLKKREIDDIRIDLQLAKENPTIERVRAKYNELYKVGVTNESKSALHYWSDFITFKKQHVTIGHETERQYKSQLKNLQQLEDKLGYKLTFDSFDKKFYNMYVHYMYEEKGYCPNTAGDKIKKLISFLNWALDHDLTKNTAFKKFKKPSNPTTIVTLSEGQLDQLLDADLSRNKKLEKVRDVFILAFSTCLRYRDVNKLALANIKHDHIELNVNKTKQPIYIPLNRFSRKILERYPNGLPRISNQKMNDYLKELGELVNFTEEVQKVRFNRNIKTIETKKLHELLTSHAGRRTYITESLRKGMIASDVMKISGHKSWASFQRYVNSSEKRLRDEVTKVWG
jgi:site-specific recombinase XerD